jgi:hypothetical protein
LTSRAKDGRRIMAAEMKYVRETGYIWTDFETNTEITKKINITPALDKTQKYRKKWLQHIHRIPRNRLRKIMQNNRTEGRRNQGRSLDF